MQISCVDYKKLDQGIRLDAEYYKPGFLQVEKILLKANCKPLVNVSQSIKSFGAYALCNKMVLVDKGIPFIRCKDIKEGFVDFSEVLYIDEVTHRLLSKSAVTANTVMLTMSGTVGNSAIADPAWKYPINSNQDIAKIETNELINPCYLTIFLNGEYGKSQTERLPIGSIQQHIFIWQLKGLLILIASKSFQNIIAKLYMKAIKSLSNSEGFYRDAKQILLSELGLLNWKPKHRLSFIKNFSDTQASERIDAEYFQPMYEEIIDKYQKTSKFDSLENLTKLIGHPSNPPYANEDSTNKTFIITQKHLGNYFPGDNFWEDPEALYTTDDFIKKNKQYILNANDIILYSVGAYIGKANIYNSNIKATIGSFLTLIRPDSEKINPYYLLVYLNSDFGDQLTRRYSRGMAQQYVYPFDIKKFIIPIISNSRQTEIEKKMLEALNAKVQARHLLDIAKRGVEMAIEKNEKDGQCWIEAELKKLNVRLD